SPGRGQAGEEGEKRDYQILAHSLPPKSHLLRSSAHRVSREDGTVETQARGPSVGPYEQLLWRNPAISLGSFDAAPQDEGFETAGAIGDRPAIAFSRSSVGIAQVKRDPFVSDGTVAVLHNPRQPYRRFRVDRRGDHCEWMSVDADLLLDLNPRLGRDPRR